MSALSMTDLPPRISRRLIVENDHWLWQGWANDRGYPYVYWDGRDQPTYRVVYELLAGPIPVGLELDHLCVIPLCCNPADLEPVTHAENLRRVAERFTHCRRAGHNWSDPRNVYTRPDGRRFCAECARERGRRRYAAESAAAIRVRPSKCRRGHDFAGPNLYVVPKTGHRRCLECVAIRLGRRAA